MLLLLAKSYVNEHFNNNEKENENENENEEYNKEYNKDIIIFIIYLAISIWAVYLSWSCNTKAKYPISVKIACAINAYTFGIFYIIYYFIAVSGTCSNGVYIDIKESDLIKLLC
jgi:hypothetical protein